MPATSGTEDHVDNDDMEEDGKEADAQQGDTLTSKKKRRCDELDARVVLRKLEIFG